VCPFSPIALTNPTIKNVTPSAAPTSSATAATATPRWSAVREFAPNGSPLPATTPAFHTPLIEVAESLGGEFDGYDRP
jgi:hypothetical protein